MIILNKDKPQKDEYIFLDDLEKIIHVAQLRNTPDNSALQRHLQSFFAINSSFEMLTFYQLQKSLIIGQLSIT